MSQGLKVKSAPADNDREIAVGIDFLNRRDCQLTKLLCAHFLAERKFSKQMVRSFLHHRFVRLSGQERQAAIDLERVRTDHLGPAPGCDFGGDLRFPARRWSDNVKGALHKKRPGDRQHGHLVSRSKEWSSLVP